MSKSLGDAGTLNLLDDPAVLAKKIKRAVTDTGTEVRYDPDAQAGRVEPADDPWPRSPTARPRASPATFAGQGYGALKKAIADAVVAFAEPFAKRTNQLLADPAELDRILAGGRGSSREVAGADARRVPTSGSASCPVSIRFSPEMCAQRRAQRTIPGKCAAGRLDRESGTRGARGGHRRSRAACDRPVRVAPARGRPAGRPDLAARHAAAADAGRRRTNWTRSTSTCAEAAADSEPFVMHLSGTGTFRPVSPVVFIQVARGVADCEVLEKAIRSGPLDRELEFPYHPHVTVAQDVPSEALDVAYDGLSGFVARFTVETFQCFARDRAGAWQTRREFPLGC